MGAWTRGVSRFLGVVARAEPVHDRDRLVSEHPCVVPARKRGDVSRARDELGAIIHPDRELSADVVLEVRSLAAGGTGDRLHVVRPSPSGLEDHPADLAVADRDDLGMAIREIPDLVWRAKALVLGLLHCDLLGGGRRNCVTAPLHYLLVGSLSTTI